MKEFMYYECFLQFETHKKGDILRSSLQVLSDPKCRSQVEKLYEPLTCLLLTASSRLRAKEESLHIFQDVENKYIRETNPLY